MCSQAGYSLGLGAGECRGAWEEPNLHLLKLDYTLLIPYKCIIIYSFHSGFIDEVSSGLHHALRSRELSPFYRWGD